jgi:hypothetical protein
MMKTKKELAPRSYGSLSCVERRCRKRKVSKRGGLPVLLLACLSAVLSLAMSGLFVLVGGGGRYMRKKENE